jgi:hypothetical protein
MSSEQEKRMAQYLLGQLPEEEEAELERRYLAEDTLFDELLAVEDDLRDAYARGELSRSDREAFERRLLAASDQQQQQEFTQMLCRNLKKTETEVGAMPQLMAKWQSLRLAFGTWPRRALVPALSVTILMLMAGSWWLGRRSVLPPATSETNSGNIPGEGMATGGLQRLEAGTTIITLHRGSRRGTKEESNTVAIPPTVSQVRLEARVEVNYPRYEAVLQTAEGKPIWKQADLKAETLPHGSQVVLDVSSSMLPPGDYILTLRGLPTTGSSETVAEYAFNVRQK